MRIRLGLVLLILLSCISVKAQNNPEAIIKQFFSTYEQAPLDAVDYLFSTNSWMEQNQEAVENVKTQLGNTLELIGEFHGQEQLSKKEAGENYVEIVYMVLHNRQPLRFSFTFYRPQNKWQAHFFKFDDDFDDELE